MHLQIDKTCEIPEGSFRNCFQITGDDTPTKMQAAKSLIGELSERSLTLSPQERKDAFSCDADGSSKLRILLPNACYRSLFS